MARKTVQEYFDSRGTSWLIGYGMSSDGLRTTQGGQFLESHFCRRAVTASRLTDTEKDPVLDLRLSPSLPMCGLRLGIALPAKASAPSITPILLPRLLTLFQASEVPVSTRAR